MAQLTRDQAIEKLGNFAFNKKNGAVLDSRVNAVISFSKENPDFEIKENNNWSQPSKPSTVKACRHIGGTTYKYQVWAVVRG